MIYYDEREVRKTSFGLHKTTKKLLQRNILKNLINTRFFWAFFRTRIISFHYNYNLGVDSANL